jgi:hypothetical protein
MNYLPLHHWICSIPLNVSWIHVTPSAKVCTNNFPLERIMHDNSVRDFLRFHFLLIQYFLPSHLFLFFCHSAVFFVCVGIIISPHLRILLYLIFILHEKKFLCYFCFFNLFSEWSEIIKEGVKASIGRTKNCISAHRLFVYNFSNIMLFIYIFM